MPATDMNVVAAGFLQDMAAAQTVERSAYGFKRAAKAIVGLDVLVSDLLESGALQEIPFVGPSSARIIAEVVAGGDSPTVAAAIAKSGKRSQIERKRALREGFLSHYAMERVLEAALSRDVVSRDRYLGDLQMHSTWSDGAEAIAGMVRGAMELGHTCLGITDHWYGLPVARGMSMSDVTRQHAEIDALNAKHRGQFRVFKGIEANILADGVLDLQPDERRRFDYVVASPHSMLRRAEDQTARLVEAVRAPGVAILGHPRGRVYNSRAGIQARWGRVFEAAAKRGVAVELDGNWHRQDLDFALASQALAAGCLFALDSDAHAVAELRFTDFAIAHARLAGIPAARVINCWPADRLSAWMAERTRA